MLDFFQKSIAPNDWSKTLLRVENNTCNLEDALSLPYKLKRAWDSFLEQEAALVRAAGITTGFSNHSEY